MADTMRCPRCGYAAAVIDGNLSKCDCCFTWMNLDEVRAIEARSAWLREEQRRYRAMIDERNRVYFAAQAEQARLLASLVAAAEEKLRVAQERKRVAAEKRRAKKRAGLAPSFLRDIEEALGQGMTRPQHGGTDG